MRLPNTFFLRLDCHQAAIVIGAFELFVHVPLAILITILNILMFTDARDELERQTTANKFLISFSEVAEILKILGILLMVFAVVSRKRYYMIPWFVATTLDIFGTLFFYSEIVHQIIALNRATDVTVICQLLWILFIILVIAIECYSILIVVCSFMEIGMANEDTPNRRGDVSIQFQAIDSNRGGLI